MNSDQRVLKWKVKEYSLLGHDLDRTPERKKSYMAAMGRVRTGCWEKRSERGWHGLRG